MGVSMRRFSIALLVLIVLGFIMSVQREERGAPVSVADAVRKEAAQQPPEEPKRTAANPAIADTKAPRTREAMAATATAAQENAESAAAVSEPAQEVAATPPSKPDTKQAAARTSPEPAIQEGEAASHTTSSAPTTTDTKTTDAASGSAAQAGKASDKAAEADRADYLPPWQRDASPSADAGKDKKAEVKAKSGKNADATKAKPGRKATHKANRRRRSRDRSVYRTAPTSSYGDWEADDWRWRRRRRRGHCYIARDGVLECDRGRVYFER